MVIMLGMKQETVLAYVDTGNQAQELHFESMLNGRYAKLPHSQVTTCPEVLHKVQCASTHTFWQQG